VREQTDDEPVPRVEDHGTRVPTAPETVDSITRAQRALAELAELAARDAEERRRADEEARAQQLSRWHQDDRAAARAMDGADGRQLDRGAT